MAQHEKFEIGPQGPIFNDSLATYEKVSPHLSPTECMLMAAVQLRAPAPTIGVIGSKQDLGVVLLSSHIRYPPSVQGPKYGTDSACRCLGSSLFLGDCVPMPKSCHSMVDFRVLENELRQNHLVLLRRIYYRFPHGSADPGVAHSDDLEAANTWKE